MAAQLARILSDLRIQHWNRLEAQKLLAHTYFFLSILNYKWWVKLRINNVNGIVYTPITLVI